MHGECVLTASRGCGDIVSRSFCGGRGVRWFSLLRQSPVPILHSTHTLGTGLGSNSIGGRETNLW